MEFWQGESVMPLTLMNTAKNTAHFVVCKIFPLTFALEVARASGGS